MPPRLREPISRACKVPSRLREPPRGLAKCLRVCANPFRGLAKCLRVCANPFRGLASCLRVYAEPFCGIYSPLRRATRGISYRSLAACKPPTCARNSRLVFDFLIPMGNPLAVACAIWIWRCSIDHPSWALPRWIDKVPLW